MREYPSWRYHTKHDPNGTAEQTRQTSRLVQSPEEDAALGLDWHDGSGETFDDAVAGEGDPGDDAVSAASRTKKKK